ncbi:MAG: exosortase [Phycisphaerales bacterium]|nr:exosortase [Phycisphaerales bacterium]
MTTVPAQVAAVPMPPAVTAPAPPIVLPPAILAGPTAWARAVLLTLGICALFWFFLVQQHRFSRDSGDWSHAYLVPLISIYLLWQRRLDIARIRPTTCWAGLLPVALGVPAYALFQISGLSNHMAQGWAMILVIFGVVLLLCGPRITRLAFLPIAFLAFGVTVSEQVMILVTFKLQLVASQGAWALLNMLGIETAVAGNQLEVSTPNGVVPLNVAEACSGMRMVIAFMALGVAVALVGARHWWQRTALLVLAVPVAVLMNVIRVTVLGVLTLQDPKLAEGQSHMLVGTLLLVPAFFLYLGMVWTLNRIVVDDAETDKPAITPAQPAPLRWKALTSPAFAAAMGVLLLSTLTLNAAVAAMGVKLRKEAIQPENNRRVAAVPAETASWQRIGKDVVLSQEMVDELGTGNYLTRFYVRRDVQPGQRPVRLELHLAYYTGMIDTVPHVPERCVTGAGWTIQGFPITMPLALDSNAWKPDPSAVTPDGALLLTAPLSSAAAIDAGKSRIRLPRNPQDIQLRVSVFSGPRDARLHAGYFFIANGGHVPNAEGVRALAFNLTDRFAYYLKVQVSSMDVATPEDLAREASSLLGELLPDIMRCVPDWADVQAGRYPAPENAPRAPN